MAEPNKIIKATATSNRHIYEYEIASIAEPVEKLITNFLQMPFNVKDGMPFLTADDIKNLTTEMTEVIKNEVNSIIERAPSIEADIRDELEEDFKQQLEDFKRNHDPIGVSFSEAESLIKHLEAYRKLSDDELVKLELKQLEYKLSEQIQTKKTW